MDAPGDIASAPIDRPVTSESSKGGASSIIEICGKYTSKCGYCKAAEKTSVSFGIVAKHLTCEDYQALIDRGWRRSGCFVYKPINHETCCPQYTIRLDVNAFQPFKSQRQALNKLRRFLDGSSRPATLSSGTEALSAGSSPADMANGHRFAAAQRVGNGGSATCGRSGSRNRDEASGSSSAHQGKRRKSKEPSAAAGAKGNADEHAVKLTEAVLAAVSVAGAAGALPLATPELSTEKLGGAAQVKPCRRADLGDYSCAIALKLAHLASRPRGTPETLVAAPAEAIALAAHAKPSAVLAPAQGRGVASGQNGNGVGRRDSEKWAPVDVAALLTPFVQREVGTDVRVVVADNGFINFFVNGGTGGAGAGASGDRMGDGSIEAAATRDAAATAATAAIAAAAAAAAVTKTVRIGADGIAAVGAGADADAAGAGRNTGKGKGKRKVAGTGNVAGSSAGAGSADAHAMAVDSGDGCRVGGGSSGASSAGMQPSRPAWRAEATAAGRSANASPPEHQLTVETVPARWTEEVFALYRTYQHRVHGDDPEEMQPASFRRFLVDSPLLHESGGSGIYGSRDGAIWDDDERGNSLAGAGADGPVPAMVATSGVGEAAGALGTYHQLYRLDGRLVAVGVVDVLPKCLSSVYCFYDPEWRAQSLGRVTALSEIEWVRQAQAVRPSLHYYYLGFYIHSCPKMSYKGAYHPSQLLCPVRYTWESLDKCRRALDSEKYVVLSDITDRESESFASGVQNGDVREGEGRGGDGDDDEMRESDGSVDGREQPQPTFKKRLRSPPLDAAGAGGGRSNGDASRGSAGKGSSQSTIASAPAGGGGDAAPPAADSSPATEPMGDDSDSGERDAVEEEREAGESGDEDNDVAFLPPPPPASASPSEAAAHVGAAAAVPSIPLLVAPATLVFFDALTSQGQAMLWPVLAEYARMAGPELAGRLLVKLHR